MTVLGVVFAALILLGLLYRPAFPWVLAFSATFPYSAAVNIAGNSVTPFHLTAFFATALLMFEPRVKASESAVWASRVGAIALAVFVAWSLFITLVAPIMFSGEPVLNARTGLDNAVEAQEPLVYTVSTLAQVGYLVLAVCAVLYLARQRPTPALALVPFAAGTVIGAVNFGFVTLGLPWPMQFFDTSTVVYSIAYRGGIFNEPSEFGGFSVAATVLFAVTAARSRGPLRTAAVCFAMLAAFNLVNSHAGTALGGIAIIGGIGALVVLWRLVVAGRGALLILFGAIAVAIALLLFGDSIIHWGADIFGGKQGSTSLSVRSSSDAFSLELALRTWGLGVGLGANRPSSFATMLLSCVGVVGALAFAAFLARILPRAARSPLGSAAVWGLLGFIAAKVVSLPDLASPSMWILIAVCTQLAWREPETSPNTTDTPVETPEIGCNHGPQRHAAHPASTLDRDRRPDDPGRGARPGSDDGHQAQLRRDRTALRRDAGQRLGR